MAIGDVIARLAVSLTLETAAFEKGATIAEKRMAQSQKNFEAIGKKMGGIGKTMSLAVTAPLVAMGIASVKAATESAEALGQVQAALKSMGKASGRTAEQLQALASSEMGKSLYDDDEILRKVTANLLTFGKVSGTAFDQAQQAAVDLSARLGQDLQSSAIMVGKALNDPVKGLAALRRVGIQFTAQQQEQIKAMVKVGDTAGAQGIMLGELQRQFGGSAEAMRKADPMGALKLSFGEFEEQVGRNLIPLLPRITNAITGLLDAFSKLSPGMQTAAVTAGILAAALGPILMATGSLIQIAAPLAAGLVTLAGVIGEAAAGATTFGGVIAAWGAGLGAALAAIAPFLIAAAAIAAVGILIYENWDKIGPVLSSLWDTIKGTLGPPLQDLIASLKTALAELWNGPLGSMVKAAIPIMEALSSAMVKVFGAAIVAMITDAAKLIGGAIEGISIAVRFLVSVFDGTLVKGGVSAVQRLYQGVKPWLDKLASALYALQHPVETATGFFHTMWDKVVGHSYVPDMVDEIAAQMARLDAVMVQPAKKATAAAAEAFQQLKGDLSSLMGQLFPEAAAQNTYTDQKGLIAKGLAAHLINQHMADAMTMRAATQYGDSLPQSSVDFGDVKSLVPAMSDIQDGLERLTGSAKENTVRIAKSFKDMATETLNSLQNLAGAIKGGGFLDILSAVVGLGMQLGSIGAFGKKVQTNINASVPHYANGTGFHPGGLALVGERGPELVNLPRGSGVTPNNQMGGGKLQVEVIANNNGFGAIVRNYAGQVVAEAAPSIASAGGAVGVQRLGYQQTRRVA